MGGSLLWLCVMAAVSWKLVSSQTYVYKNLALGRPTTSRLNTWQVSLVTDGRDSTFFPMGRMNTQSIQVDLGVSMAVYAVSTVWSNMRGSQRQFSILVGNYTIDNETDLNPKCQDMDLGDEIEMSTAECEGINGRYVILTFDKTMSDCNLCEVMVSGTPLAADTRVVIHGEAAQSSVLANGADAWQAITSSADNALSPALCMTSKAATTGAGCSVTKMDFEPWWLINMTVLYKVRKVTIAGRGDIHGLRLFGADIYVKTGLFDILPFKYVCAQDIFVTPGHRMTFACPDNAIGRFLVVQLPKRVDSLGLCEVTLQANPRLPHAIYWKNGTKTQSNFSTN